MGSIIAMISTPIVAVIISLCVTWFWNYFISSEWRLFNMRVNNKLSKTTKKFNEDNQNLDLKKYIIFFNECIQFLLTENKNKIIGNKLSKKLIIQSIENNYDNLICLSDLLKSDTNNKIDFDSKVLSKDLKSRDDEITKIIDKKFGSVGSKLELISEFVKINFSINGDKFETSFNNKLDYQALKL